MFILQFVKIFYERQQFAYNILKQSPILNANLYLNLVTKLELVFSSSVNYTLKKCYIFTIYIQDFRLMLQNYRALPNNKNVSLE